MFTWAYIKYYAKTAGIVTLKEVSEMNYSQYATMDKSSFTELQCKPSVESV